jgi:choline dehydrogenase-like flavoprotein
VREVTVDAAGRARGAIYRDRTGAEHHQDADIVVLAANGVGTPRLMLLSTSPQHPAGLANSSGLVGRRLMLHPTGVVVGVYDDDLEAWKGPAGQPIHSFQFYDTDTDRGFVRGAKWQVMPTQGPHRMISLLDGEPFDTAWGSALQEHVRTHIGRCIDWGAITEDLPDEANGVTLDPVVRDGDGIPAPRITYTVAENNWRQLDWHLARITEAHVAGGARATYRLRICNDQPGHLLGTARMGTDPATSVCDPWGRTHDVPNLFVVDGSLFVTAGGVNPTSTICALALRTAGHIADTASKQAVAT